jgi:hypothetical protein
MSLAHLREAKPARSRATAGAAAAGKAAKSPAAYCGASHEPMYRSMEEAEASGLQLCDSCVVLFRQRPKPR